MSTAQTMPETLREGQRLDQPTFHRLYEEASRSRPGLRAELIEGVVHFKMSISRAHGRPHAALTTWLYTYDLATPGTESVITPTLILGRRSEPEPDLILRRLPESGGRCVADDRDILHGPPELAVEVSRTTAPLDLGGKFRDYQAAGVGEYLVLLVELGEVRWWGRPAPEAGFEELAPDAGGVFRSRVFRGLWLDAHALLADDGAALLATLQTGIADPSHAAFVDGLQGR